MEPTYNALHFAPEHCSMVVFAKRHYSILFLLEDTLQMCTFARNTIVNKIIFCWFRGERK